MIGAKDPGTKARDTRAKILEAALTLFRERGFAQATMREIAARAKVATGLAYYYFDSKDAIVLAFYHRAKDELPERLTLAHQEPTLAGRIEALIAAKFTYFAPNRRFLGALMSHAANPHNALSPFSEASKEVRDFDIAQFQRALDETGTTVPRDLAPHMATILWLYQLGLLLFWIYDSSPGQTRSRDLIKASVRIVVVLLTLSRLPLLKPARKSVLNILEILQSPAEV
jgi:AcrR family transcriptional regulator